MSASKLTTLAKPITEQSDNTTLQGRENWAPPVNLIHVCHNDLHIQCTRMYMLTY